jgi:hypothetical protein
MIFTVPKSFKGSFVLNTLNRALSKGMTVSISGNKLYAADIKMAIASGILVPVGEDYGEDKVGVSHDVVLVNKTSRVMVLGETVLNPNGSLLVSKDALGDTAIKAAIKNGLIGVISKDAPIKKTTKKKVAKKKTTKKKITKKEVEEEVFDEETDQFIPGAEREMHAKAWDFREQVAIDAQVVPTTPDMISVDEEEEEEEVEDVEFVDEPLEAQKVNAKKKKVTKKAKKKTKKKAVKKAKKKKAVKKTIKKKGKATKKRKVKALEPVGDKRLPKTQMDAAIELDSRGRPLGKASDTLNHLIDSVDTGDVTFVDDEQAQARYNDRTDMD